ncbi:uncharacterized protein [Macrobrachium rosenbergii]|uniref:uncharacterized protein n=1 Tax=Macrobrachium rosenbergii TaxID=79674 RepID=UPI0034D46592
MRTFKVLCLLLVALTVRGTPVTEPSPEAKGGTGPKAASKSSPSPLPKTSPNAKSVTTESDAEILTQTTTDQLTTTSPDATSDTEPSTDPGTDQSEVTTPSSSPKPSAGTTKRPKSSSGPRPKTVGGNRHRDTGSIPTTSPEPDTDVQSDAKQLSPDSGPKPDPSSKPRETSSTKTRDESKTKSPAGPESKRPLLQPLVNKQKPGGPNPESKSQFGFGNGFGLPGSDFPINPRPILTGAGETGLNNFPLSGGDPTFVELPFQDSFNNRQPSRGNPNSLQPRPVSPTGEVFPGAFGVGSQGQGFEIPVNTGLVVNPPNNVPQNTGLFGVPPRGPFDFGRPFGNPTVQRPFVPGSSGFPQGTTPQPPLFFNSRPGGTTGLFAPNPSSSPPLFLNPNIDNSFARPTTPQPFPPRPSNPPPLFLNPVTPNPASRPSVFLTPQPGNLFIPEDRIPFSSSPNDLNDPSPFFNSLGDTGSNDLFPDRPSVLFLNPDRDVLPPRGPPSIFLNPEDSPPIFTGSRPRPSSGFP